MRIAMPSEDGTHISDHFGRSPFFAIFDVDGGTARAVEVRRNGEVTEADLAAGDHHDHGHHDDGHGHDHAEHHHNHGNIVGNLADCQAVLVHGIGRPMAEALMARGIQVIPTDEVEALRAAERYGRGQLR
ncbi:MAG: NifB/NifX family molybdenum-iron cluster-binding protein [Bacillota bacterium]